MKTIAVDSTCHALLKTVADEHGMKFRSVVSAWGRGWLMLDPAQQAEAIRLNGAPLTSFPSPLCQQHAADIRREGLRLDQDTSTLNIVLNEMLSDGQITKAEKKKLLPLLKRVSRRAEVMAMAGERA